MLNPTHPELFELDEEDFNNPTLVSATTAALSPPSSELFELDMGPQDFGDVPNTDPEIVQKRVDKADKALGSNSPGKETLLNQFANGDEPALREAQAQAKALEDRQKRLQMIREAASTINRPLTQEEADGIMSSAVDTTRDPKTILEELYGEKLALETPSMLRKAGVEKMAMAEEMMDAADAVQKHAARSQIARTVLEDTEATWKAAGIWDTGMSWVKQIIPLYSYSNQLGAIKSPDSGVSVVFGRTLEQEIEYLYTLKPSAFREELTAAIKEIANDNPLDAYSFAQKVVAYAPTDAALDTAFGLIDIPWKGAGVVAGAVGVAAAKGVFAGAKAIAPKATATVAERVRDVADRIKTIRGTEVASKAPVTPESPIKPVGTPEPVVEIPTTSGYSVTWDNKNTTFTYTPEGASASIKGTPGAAPQRADMLARYTNEQDLIKEVPPSLIDKPEKVREYVTGLRILKDESVWNDLYLGLYEGLAGFTPGRMKDVYSKFPDGMVAGENRFKDMADTVLQRIETGMKKGQSFDELLKKHEQALHIMRNLVDDASFEREGFKTAEEFADWVKDNYNLALFQKAYSQVKENTPRAKFVTQSDSDELSQHTRIRPGDKPMGLSTRFSVKLDLDKIMANTEKRAENFTKGSYDSLQRFFKDSGVGIDIQAGPRHNETQIREWLDKLSSRAASKLTDQQKALIDSFADPSFKPWGTTYRFEPDVAVANIHPKTAEATVSVDPKYVDKAVRGQIAGGGSLYPGSTPLPQWLASNPSALFELILWHETAHGVLGGRLKNMPIPVEEDLVNGMALLKLFQTRAKPGVSASRTATMGPTQQPIPYVINTGVAKNTPREPAVVFDTVAIKRKITPYTSYDSSKHTLTVNRSALEKQWERKPWANSKTAQVKPIGTNADFPTPDDWVEFSIEKAKFKALLPKPKGTRFSDHENYINDLALQSFRVKKAQEGSTALGIMRDTARSSADELGIDSSTRTGDMDKAVADEVLKRVYDEWQGKDVLDNSKELRRRTVSLFDVDSIGNEAHTLPRERVDRILRNLRANAGKLLGTALNNAAIVRIPEAALKKAIEETQKSLSSTYNRANDAFLDITLGGPFRVTRPEDQLVNTTVVHLRMGKPGGQLFDNPTQATTFGVDMYGLQPSQFNILQQGQGFFIQIDKAVDETLDSVRNAIVQTDNASPKGWLNTFTSWMRTSDDTVGKLANENRMLATTAAQELHRIFKESAQNIGKSLSKEERSQLEAIWIKNRDEIYDELTPDGSTVTKRGFYYNTLEEFERAFHDRFHQVPSEAQTQAYFEYVQINDMDYILRNLALHRDMGRMGAEEIRVAYDVMDINGADAVEWSKGFAGRFTDRLPLEDQSEDFGIWMYDPATKKGEYFLRSQVTPDVAKEFDNALQTRGFKVVEVVNPLEKPLAKAANTNDVINFMVVKNYQNKQFDWAILPRQPGGHVEYGDGFFVKQPRIRRSQSSGTQRHIYEGDTSLLNAATQAEAEKFSKAAETARQLLRDGKEAELKTFLYQNTPWDIATWKSFFTESVDDLGRIKPALLHIDDPITWTYTGRNTSDMDHFKGAFGNYSNFFNGVRSKYNLFAQGVDKKYLGSRDPDLPRVNERGSEATPLYSLEKPRLLSPLETLSKAIANVSRSRHMNDYKTSAVESFIEEFKDVMKTDIAEMRRNPVYYFHNPVWDTETTNKQLLNAAQAAHRAHTYFIGAESELGSKMWWVQSKLADTIYKKLGQDASNYVTERFIPTVKDPFTYARSIAFHSKLGLFNPVQLFLQAQSWVHVMAIAGPEMAFKSAGDAIRMRQLALTEDSKIIDSFAKMSGRGKLFKESYSELKKTGYYNVGGEVAWRDDVFDPQLFQSTVGTFLEKGAMFFNEGERFVRLSAWNAAFYGWREANPNAEITNAVRNQILKRADLMAVNMTRASNAAWQQGLFSVPTQFLSFQARMAEQLLPGWSDRLTSQEKLRAFLTYSAIYGVPVGAGAVTAIYPYHEDIRQAALEKGIDLDNRVTQAFNEGIVDTMFSAITGKEYNLNERYGPKGTSIVKEIINGDMTMTEILLGASGSIIGDMISSAVPATNALLSLFTTEVSPPTMEDFMEVTRNVSTVNNAVRAWYMYNQGRYFTRNGSVVMDDATGFDAYMQAMFGVTPEAATDTFVMIKSRKEQREAEADAEKEVIKWYRKSIREYNDGNQELGDAYLKRAKAWLISGGFRPDQYSKILNNAIKGNETLFNSIREDFWRKAPTGQGEARRQMIQGQ